MADNILQLKIIVDGKEGVAMLDQAQLKLSNFKKETAGAGAAGQKTAGDMKSMQMAVGQFGWVLGDANMFLVNFRMGLMSIGNNIPMVVQYMSMAKQEAQAMGMTIGQSLVKSLAGPAGLMLAVNGVMFLMQLLPAIFGKATDAAKEQAKSIKDLRNEYASLSKAAAENEIAKRELELRTMDKMPGQTYYYNFGQRGPKITDEERYGDNLAKAQQLNKEIIALKQQAFYSNELSDAESRLATNRKKFKQINKENYAFVVEGSKTYQEAYDKIVQWIKADEAMVKRLSEPIKADDPKKAAEEAKKRIQAILETLEMDQAHEMKLFQIEVSKREEDINAFRIQQLEKEIAVRIQLGQEIKAQRNELIELRRAQMVDLVNNAPIKGGAESPKSLNTIDGIPKPKLFKETSKELEAQLILLDAWESAASSATDALASGLTENIQLFGRADNALSNFANKFIQILLQKAILGFVNMMTGGFGSLLGGLFGAPVSGGGGGLSTLNSGGSLSSSATKLVRIELHAETKLKGGDIYQAWKGERNYREKYT